MERGQLLAAASLPGAEVRRVQTWWATARCSMAGEAVEAVRGRGESGERGRVCRETGRAVSCLWVGLQAVAGRWRVAGPTLMATPCVAGATGKDVLVGRGKRQQVEDGEVGARSLAETAPGGAGAVHSRAGRALFAEAWERSVREE